MKIVPFENISLGNREKWRFSKSKCFRLFFFTSDRTFEWESVDLFRSVDWDETIGQQVLDFLRQDNRDERRDYCNKLSILLISMKEIEVQWVMDVIEHLEKNRNDFNQLTSVVRSLKNHRSVTFTFFNLHCSKMKR